VGSRRNLLKPKLVKTFNHSLNLGDAKFDFDFVK
jgi:hypothetical protein